MSYGSRLRVSIRKTQYGSERLCQIVGRTVLILTCSVLPTLLPITELACLAVCVVVINDRYLSNQSIILFLPKSAHIENKI